MSWRCLQSIGMWFQLEVGGWGYERGHGQWCHHLTKCPIYLVVCYVLYFPNQINDRCKAVISLDNTQIRIYVLEPAGTFFSYAGHCFQMMSNDYFLFCLWFFCHADMQICRYADRCSPIMSSNQLPEVVVGFAGPPHLWRISKLSRKCWRDKHQLWQDSMPVIPVNPNHPSASAARKWTPSAVICESPPQAAKARANNALMHGDSASPP